MFARILVALTLVACLASPPASAGIFGDAPDAIVCPFKAITDLPAGMTVFYIDARAEDGRLVYKTLGVAPLVFIVGADGVVQPGKVKLEGCTGQSLSALRKEGRAFNFR